MASWPTSLTSPRPLRAMPLEPYLARPRFVSELEVCLVMGRDFIPSLCSLRSLCFCSCSPQFRALPPSHYALPLLFHQSNLFFSFSTPLQLFTAKLASDLHSNTSECY